MELHYTRVAAIVLYRLHLVKLPMHFVDEIVGVEPVYVDEEVEGEVIHAEEYDAGMYIVLNAG